MIKNLQHYHFLARTLSRNQYYPIATQADTIAKNYLKFKAKYDEHVRSFEEKIKKFEHDNRAPLKKPTAKPYIHPFNNEHNPITFSNIKVIELYSDFIGPEQVSAHYENFLVSRKYAISFIGGLGLLTLLAGTADMAFIAQSSIIPYLYWTLLMYFIVEGRKSLLKPLLMRFYRRVTQHEVDNFFTYYHENVEVVVRKLVNKTKEQIDYTILHNEFQNVKAEAVNVFLANEYTNLQKHISDRTINILKQVKTYENINQQRLIDNLVKDASAQIDKELSGPNLAKIKKDIFESALEGLSKGYMDYAIDPILPIVKQSIKSNVAKVTTLSPKEQDKLISLTEEQLKVIRESDRAAKQEFLNTQPGGIDSSLKNNEVVKKILNNWSAGNH